MAYIQSSTLNPSYTVENATRTSPPTSPVSNTYYIIAGIATGAWTGKENKIAWYINSGWIYITPLDGWTCWNKNTKTNVGWNGTSWQTFTATAENTLWGSGQDRNIVVVENEDIINSIVNSNNTVNQRSTADQSGHTTGGIRIPDGSKAFYIDGTVGSWTGSVVAGAPYGGVWFKHTCNTADTPGTNEGVGLQLKLEGLTLQKFKKGFNEARWYSFSFDVLCLVAGTYICEFFDGANVRHCCQAFTLISSSSPQRVNILIPPDIQGIVPNDINSGLIIILWYCAGSGYQSGTLATSWAAYNQANRAVGCNNLAATNGNSIAFSNFQLNPGRILYPYVPENKEDNLLRCYRYLQKFGGNVVYENCGLAIANDTQNANAHITAKYPMRYIAAVTPIGNWTLDAGNDAHAISSFNLNTGQSNNVNAFVSVTSSALTPYRPYFIRAENSVASELFLNGEL